MAQKRLRLAIAGQGRSGYGIHFSYLVTAQKQYEIVAVSDENKAQCSEAVEQTGCNVYTDYRKMLREEKPDLFVNAMPSNMHPKGSIQALNMGIHTVCEKPLAVRVKDFDQAVEAAKANKALYAPFQNSRFRPVYQKMREVIDSGVLGEIIHVRISYSNFARRWDWQTLQPKWGGNLNNTGPHPMDHAIMFYGDGRAMPNVFAKLFSGPGSTGDADDFALVVLTGKNRPTVEVLLSSYQAYPIGDPYVISGTRGGLTAAMDGCSWRYYDPKKAPKLKPHKAWAPGRAFCREELPWVETSWKEPPFKAPDGASFPIMSKGFYDNIYDVLVNKGKLVVTPAQVRTQIRVIEECHRQNPLPRKKRSPKTMRP